MKIVIVGPGAMGCLFASRIAGGGHNVTLLDYKPDRAQLISEMGILISDGDTDSRVFVRVSADPGTVEDAEGLIFMVKAYSTEAAAARLVKNVPADAWIMTLQNGMGNVEALASIFGGGRTLVGTTSQGATLREAGSVIHAGRGDTFVGEPDGAHTPRIEAVAAMFTDSGIPAKVSDDVTGLLWRKLLVSVGINPVTALLLIRNGEILERESARELMAAAVAEAAGVANAAGVDIGVADPVALAEDVARKTAANVSSMHQDIVSGRRTEIDSICGTVVREGERLGVPTPINRSLCDLIRALEVK